MKNKCLTEKDLDKYLLSRIAAIGAGIAVAAMLITGGYLGVKEIWLAGCHKTSSFTYTECLQAWSN